MKNIFLFILLYVLFFGQNVNAQTINVHDALAKAKALRGSKHKRMKASSGSNIETELAYTETNSGAPLFYVFNYSDGGFAIIGGDERAREILGYCDEGSFNIDSIPDGLKYMLGCYGEQISNAITNDMTPATSIARNASSVRSSISPLLTTRWNQNGSWPKYLNAYNSQLPKITDNSIPLATGCVATALAQIMKFYNYPTRGQGSPKSYDNQIQWNGAPTLTLYADFANTTYDWSNMLDEYPGTYGGTQSEIAVGTLMYHVGVAVDMIYGQCTSGGSGAYDRNVGPGMATYLGYNNATLKSRGSYTDSEWENLVFSELIQNHPLYYSGSNPNSTSGHAFVCDGYDSTNDIYHFNWGWGGSCDGYYPITGTGALQPGGSGTGGSGNNAAYTDGQVIYVGLYPASASVLVTGISLSATSASLTVGGTKTLTATITPSNATNKNVTWSSSNTSVATVSTSGVVTAKAAGTATITCTAADGSGKSATCSVTVTSSLNLSGRSNVVTTNTAGATVSFSTSNTYEWEWDSANNRMRSTNYNMNSTTSQTTINISTTKSTDLSFAYAVSSESGCDKLTITLDGTTIVNAISGTASSTYSGTLASGSHTLIVKYSKDGSLKSGDDRAYFSNLQLKSSTVLVTGISLNNTSASLTVGDTKALTATITPTNATNKNVTWSSSNTSVATVSSSGVVTAKAAGTATITCTAADGSGKSATCNITVTSSLNLSGRSNVVTSNTAGATVSFSTSDAYEWEWDSENSRMRSTNYNINSSTSQTTINISTTKSTELSFAYAVSSESSYDKLTITLDGTTIVDAISGTTSSTYSGTLTTGSHTMVLKYSKDISGNSGDDRAYFSNLQLKSSTVLVTGISLNSTSASLTVGETKSLTATITPTNATNKNVTWKSSNTSVASVSTLGVVTAVGAGNATITCTAADGSGKSATCSITVTPAIIDGDANGDKDVDVSDVALTVEHILGHNPSGFVLAAADLDKDGVIDVADVALMVNIIMYGTPYGPSYSNHAKGKAAESTPYLDITPDDCNLNLWLQNTDNTLSALQFDLALPEGVEVKYVLPSSFMTTHSVSSSLQENGMTRVLCISLNNAQLSPDEHGILTLTLSEQVERLHYLGLNNIVVTTPSGEKKHLNDISWSGATSIDNATGESQQKDIYSVNGQKHQTLHRGVNIIKTPNGSYKKVINKK